MTMDSHNDQYHYYRLLILKTNITHMFEQVGNVDVFPKYYIFIMQFIYFNYQIAFNVCLT